MQQLQQKDWIEQQIREKKLYQDQAKFDHDQHEAQTLHFNKLLEEAQKNKADALTAMEKATTDANRQLAQEKKDREAAEHAYRQFQGNHEQNFTLTHDFMTENPKTEQSMLAPHRVKPYHFKGFSAQQTADVMHERDLQVKEAEMLKKTK